MNITDKIKEYIKNLEDRPASLIWDLNSYHEGLMVLRMIAQTPSSKIKQHKNYILEHSKSLSYLSHVVRMPEEIEIYIHESLI